MDITYEFEASPTGQRKSVRYRAKYDVDNQNGKSIYRLIPGSLEEISGYPKEAESPLSNIIVFPAKEISQDPYSSAKSA